MKNIRIKYWIQSGLSLIATLFGLITIAAGFGVLLNFSDPGYTVFKPLLIFNSVMGIMYLITGLMIWKNIKQGIKASKIVVILNLSVLIVITILYKTSQDIVAVNSLYAMSFRTIVWIVIYFGLVVIKKKSRKN